jgi:NAD(P)-dependent dehydrogenase (short-subunit alcohol dehydrogenase family)
MPKTVVITGASAGVGRAAAQLWATEHRGALMAGTLAIVAFVTTLIVGSKPLARVYQTSSEPARLDDPGD